MIPSGVPEAVAPPEDAELLRRIHTTAHHVSANPSLLNQLLVQHANDEKLQFIQPSAGKDHRYFQWALYCKSQNQNNDPEAMAKIALKSHMSIPPPLPEIVEVSSEQVQRIDNLLQALVTEADKRPDDTELLEHSDYARFLNSTFPSQDTRMKKIANDLMDEIRTLDMENEIETLIKVFAVILYDSAYRRGTVSESDKAIPNSIQPLSTNFDQTVRLLTRCMGLLQLVFNLLELTEEKDMSRLKEVVWNRGSLPWMMRCVTVIADALHRQRYPKETPTGIIRDYLSLWTKRFILHRFSQWEASERWRISSIPPCPVDNQFRQFDDSLTIYQYPREEIIRKIETGQFVNPYLIPVPPHLAAGSPFGRLPPPTSESGARPPEELPVGVMASLLSQSSQKIKAMNRGFIPYEPLATVQMNVPPRHPHPDEKYINLADQCLKDMASAGIPTRRNRRFESDDVITPNTEKAPPITEILSGNSGLRSATFPGRPTFDDRRGMSSSKQQFFPAPHRPVRSTAGGKAGLGSHMNVTDNPQSIFDAFRQRRSGTYHQGIINYKMGQSNAAGTRCYVCQQEGHFAKDCKFGLN